MNPTPLKAINLSTDMLEASQISSYVEGKILKLKNSICTLELNREEFQIGSETEPKDTKIDTFIGACDAGDIVIVGSKTDEFEDTTKGLYYYSKEDKTLTQSNQKTGQFKHIIKGKNALNADQYVALQGKTKSDTSTGLYVSENGKQWTKAKDLTVTNTGDGTPYFQFMNNILFVNGKYYVSATTSLFVSRNADIAGEWDEIQAPLVSESSSSRVSIGSIASDGINVYCFSKLGSLYVSVFNIESGKFTSVKDLNGVLPSNPNVVDGVSICDGDMIAYVGRAVNMFQFSIVSYDKFQTFHMGGKFNFDTTNDFPRSIVKARNMYYIGTYSGRLVYTLDFVSFFSEFVVPEKYSLEGLAIDSENTIYMAYARRINRITPFYIGKDGMLNDYAKIAFLNSSGSTIEYQIKKLDEKIDNVVIQVNESIDKIME